jgi:hypothetical protein
MVCTHEVRPDGFVDKDLIDARSVVRQLHGGVDGGVCGVWSCLVLTYIEVRGRLEGAGTTVVEVRDGDGDEVGRARGGTPHRAQSCARRARGRTCTYTKRFADRKSGTNRGCFLRRCLLLAPLCWFCFVLVPVPACGGVGTRMQQRNPVAG